MRQAVKAMVDVACTLAEGRYPDAGSFLPRGVRELSRTDVCGGARAVAMLAARLSGVPVTTELPLPRFDRVDPAPPLRDVRTATIVFATEGGLAPQGNPDGIEMSMATRFRMLLAGGHGQNGSEPVSRLPTEDTTTASPRRTRTAFCPWTSCASSNVRRPSDGSPIFFTRRPAMRPPWKMPRASARPSPRISANASRKMWGSFSPPPEGPGLVAVQR